MAYPSANGQSLVTVTEDPDQATDLMPFGWMPVLYIWNWAGASWAGRIRRTAPRPSMIDLGAVVVAERGLRELPACTTTVLVGEATP